MNIGIDLHDTFTYCPQFFIELINIWPHKKYIVTGTPESDKESVIKILDNYNITNKIDGVLLGFNYDKNQMNFSHFTKMAEHKLKLIRENNITIYYDDNPFYVSFLRNHGVIIFQTIVSNEYVNQYKIKDKYFTSHLQEKQFDFLKDII